MENDKEIEDVVEDFKWWEFVGGSLLFVMILMVIVILIILFSLLFLDVIDFALRNIERFRLEFPYVYELFN